MKIMRTLAGGGGFVRRLVRIGDYVIAESAGQHPHLCMGIIVEINDDDTIEVQRQLAPAPTTCSAGGVVMPEYMIFGLTATFVEETRKELREAGKMLPE